MELRAAKLNSRWSAANAYRGPDALREILAGFDTAPGADPSHHKRNYGWFHQWLMGIRQSSEFEPIRAVVRTHIAGAAPWRAGRALLGAEVDKGDLLSEENGACNSSAKHRDNPTDDAD